MKTISLFSFLLISVGISAQNIGIETTVPSEKLEIGTGNLKLSNSDKGILLNSIDRPLVTRGWNPFTSGIYNGVGRWGLFMEPTRITVGFPLLAGSGFKISAYDVNSTIAKNVMDIGLDASSKGLISTDGRVIISSNSLTTESQLTLTETEFDYSRLSFKNTVYPQFWSITGINTAASNGDRLNIYNSTKGDILSLTGDGNIEVVSGNIKMSSSDKGIILNGVDRPFVTRGWDPFTSGANSGLGRWGLFMEPGRITMGFPAVAGRGFAIAAYDVSSTITKNVLDISLDGSLNGVVRVDGSLTRAATGSNNLLPIAYGNIDPVGTISSGSGNFSCARPFTGFYEITINGENYVSSNYTTIITIAESNIPMIAVTSSSANKLRVSIWNLVPDLQNVRFHFVVYKQ